MRKNRGRKKPKLIVEAKKLLEARRRKNRSKMHARQRKERRKQINRNRVPKTIPYKSSQQILVVGDGNFSFSAALSTVMGTAKNITATAYDSAEVLIAKYKDAHEHIKALEASGGRVLLGVDARSLEEYQQLANSNPFDVIVWNFPHSGSGIKDTVKNIQENQKLLVEFFVSAYELLATDGVIHVTIKRGAPYSDWEVVKLATQTGIGLEHKGALEFHPAAYPGYAHRRTIGFDDKVSSDHNADIKGGAITYVFRKSPDAIDDNSDSDDSDSDVQDDEKLSD